MKSVEIDSAVHGVYNQWTRFGDFPRFYGGVKQVVMLEDQRLRWETEFAGKKKAWDATITDLTPDKRIAWESEDGDYIAGIVTFEPVANNRTRVYLELFYDSKGSARDEEQFLSSIGHRVEEDLHRFQKLMEDRHSR